MKPTKKTINKLNEKDRKAMQIKELVYTAIIMTIGSILFKTIPMQIYGSDILFDASRHITIACFILYFIYFFIDQKKSWRIPYAVFCFFILTVISVQRIISNAHNDVGLLLGLIISVIAIAIPRWNEIKKEIKF